MQTVAMDPTEEPPSVLWGLDPVFSAFARLYIKDILQMTESIQVPGNRTHIRATQGHLGSGSKVGETKQKEFDTLISFQLINNR